MTDETTKSRVKTMLSKLADTKKKEMRKSFIRPEPSGGFDKLSSQGVGASECVDDKDKKEVE